MKNHVSISIISLLLLSMTSFSQRVIKKDISDNYNPSSSLIHPQYFVYQNSDSTTILHLTFFSKDFPQLEKNASVVFSYIITIFNSDNAFRAEDVVEQSFSYHFNPETAHFTDDIALHISNDINWLIDIRILNSSGIEIAKKTIPIEVKKQRSQPDMFFSSSSNSTIISKRYILDSLIIVYNKNTPAQSLTITYSGSSSPIATVPYSRNNDSIPQLQNDSMFVTDSFDSTIVVKLPHEGYYTISSSNQPEQLFNVLRKEDSFPVLNNCDQMLDALKYLDRSINADSLKRSKIGSKIELDKFWFTIASKNVNKAKELIRVYYNRVFLANEYFTSYKEGWKTDRGMIFILYGLPNKVHYMVGAEEWVYYNRFDYEDKLLFTFKSPETTTYTNNYYLQRSEAYRFIYNLALREWQNGVIFDYYNYDISNNE